MPSSDDSSPDAVRILLFGLPSAGKTSLLGALAQSARTQENLLHGRLTDLSNRFTDLQKSLYEPGGPTTQEVAAYPVDFEPFADDLTILTSNEHIGAVLIDCDGKIVNEMLERDEIVTEDNAIGGLTREVVRAEVLLLLVDVSGTLPQIDAEFAEFDRFLRLLENYRGNRVEVGGLPVFLVLTKCDLLARPGDSTGAWMEKIEERKRDIDKLFREFPGRSETADKRAFGSLDIHLWATATKRPAPAGSAGREREPYGVAELFRQCLEQSVLHRARRERANQRLFWLASATGGMAGAMLLLMLLLIFTSFFTPPTGGIRARVEEMRFSTSALASDRLRGSLADLHRRLADLAAFQQDPEFTTLTSSDRDYISGRIGELEGYIAYYEKVREVTPPGDVTSDARLHELTDALRALTPREEWQSTNAGQLQADRLADAEALTKAVDRAKRWFTEAHDKARDLWLFARYQPTPQAPAINWRGWYDEVARVLDPSNRLPFDPDAEIPGTKLPYATALRYESALEARAEWEGMKDRLLRVLDVSAALGLLTDVKDHPVSLVIPRPPDFALPKASARLKQLQENYPRYRTEFVVNGLPDAMVAAVRQAARSNLEHLLDPGRETVLGQLIKLSADGDSPAAWKKVADWLAGNPQELAAWRALALVLARLNEADAADPVSALTVFLQKPAFPIEINQLTLEVPYRYTEVKPQPGADLEIHHPATSATTAAISCFQEGEGRRDDDRKVTTYSFRPRERQRLVYHPGEQLSATLKLRDERMLSWNRNHSNVFQFERLRRPPRLHRATESSEDGTLAEGIDLIISPADGIPRIPALMPEVRSLK
jgi:GTPase SAR1 family protein